MITKPQNNVQLTNEQTRQIEVFQSRLSNLQTEVSIGTTTLNALKNDIVRIAKDKKYQEELLATVNTKITETEKKLTELFEQIVLTSNEVAINTKKSEELANLHIEKHNELVSWETSLKEKESLYQQDIQAFSVEKEGIARDRLTVEKAKEAFLEAWKTIIW